jgi:hypothetical protein
VNPGSKNVSQDTLIGKPFQRQPLKYWWWRLMLIQASEYPVTFAQTIADILWPQCGQAVSGVCCVMETTFIIGVDREIIVPETDSSWRHGAFPGSEYVIAQAQAITQAPSNGST